MDRAVEQLLLRDTLLAKNLTTAVIVIVTVWGEDMIAAVLAAEVVADIHLL